MSLISDIRLKKIAFVVILGLVAYFVALSTFTSTQASLIGHQMQLQS